jgi:urocanate hydratase
MRAAEVDLLRCRCPSPTRKRGDSLKKYAKETGVRHGRGVLEINERGAMPFDSVNELTRYVNEHGESVSNCTVHSWVGDGKIRNGFRYEWEPKEGKA